MLYIFAPNQTPSKRTSFLGDPFLPLTLSGPSDQYLDIQLQRVLSIKSPSACPYYNAVHTEQLFNADSLSQGQVENSLSFDVPADHPDAQYVQQGNLVGFWDLDHNFQLFEILRAEQIHTNTLVVNAYCLHLAQSQLGTDWIDYCDIAALDAQSALSKVLDGTLWQVGNVDSLGTQSLTLSGTNVLAALGSLIGTWGGELGFRVEVSGSKITGQYVDWVLQRGAVTGKRFVYGKDIKSVDKTADDTNLFTALYGYGKQDTNGTPLSFATVEWSTANGDPVDKPAGQKWVGDPSALAKYGWKNGTINRFGEYKNSSQTDAATLLQETWNQVQAVNTPKVSYAMSVVDLERITGYSHEKTRIGDTTATIDTEFQPALRLTARVIQVARDLINFDNTKIVLGNFFPSTVKTDVNVSNLQFSVGSLQAGAITRGEPISTSYLQGVIDTFQNQLRDDKGYVYDLGDSNGIIILNKPIDQNPTSALKLGGGIFAIANSKLADGSWNWTTFGTGSGFVADLITAGTLKAIDIQSVTITGSSFETINGSNTVTIKNGLVQAYTANYQGSGWNVTASLDGGGLNFSATSGSITETGGIYYWPGNAATLLAGNGQGINNYNDRTWTANVTVDDGTGGITGNSLTITGTKSAMVTTKDYGRQTLYAVEAPENWFEDVKEGVVGTDGRTAVELDAIFAQTIDTSKEPLKVFVQGIGAQVELMSRSRNGFEVKGPPGTEFIYRVLGRRVDFPELRFNPAVKPPNHIVAMKRGRDIHLRWAGHPAHRFNVYQDGVKVNRQALETPMLRLPDVQAKASKFTITEVDHIGQESIHSEPVQVSMDVPKTEEEDAQ